MAPGKKRGVGGGSRGSSKDQLQVGDLVLAKVKGHPAWPAKIGRPEKYRKVTPDPKKYFVEFFGTQEIANVAPSDIQPFTNDAMKKLLARTQAKKPVKHFATAVKEICEAFEEMQGKSSGDSEDDTMATERVTVLPVDGVAVEQTVNLDVVVLKKEVPGDERHGLKHCSIKLDEALSGCMKPSNSSGANIPVDEDNPVAKLYDSSAQKDEVSDGDYSEVPPGFENVATHLKKLDVEEDKVENKANYLGGDSNADFSLHESGKPLKLREQIDVNSAESSKSLVVAEKHVAKSHKSIDVDDLTKGAYSTSNEAKGKLPIPENQQKPRERKLGSDDDSRPKKKPKRENVNNAIAPKSNLKSSASKKGDTRLEIEQSSPAKSKNKLSRNNNSADASNIQGDENVLPPSKRRQQNLVAKSDRLTESSRDTKRKSSDSRKKDGANSKFEKSLASQAHTRRKILRYVDSDEEECMTPIHHNCSNVPKSLSTDVSEFVSIIPPLGTPANTEEKNTDGLTGDVQDFPPKDELAPVKPLTESTVLCLKQTDDKRPSVADEDRKPMVDSPDKLHVASPTANVHKAAKSQSKIHGIHTNVTVQTGSTKVLNVVPDSSKRSLVKSTNQKSLAAISSKKAKSTPKPFKLEVDDEDHAAQYTLMEELLSKERLEASKMDNTTCSPADAATSMKHLIAVAQAKRKQAFTQSQDNNVPALVVSERIATPVSLSQPSPSAHGCQILSEHVKQEKTKEERVSPGYRETRRSLSGGTEAAVARDAFEGMIETLSRTKDSIGRATRLAIDCAKYGIASEVVELLIRKLENESTLHRRIDLFFLVDSITQCSHSQKGIAGASYIPTVQAALPRLLGAAAPPGSGARENRRQCHKVLRLWLERKILPESTLRRYMDDIGVSNDDMNAGFHLRRPSRAERAIDDPIREMDGMLVDEYGSNATFQLPGLLSSHILEDIEDDLSDNSERENENDSPGRTSKEPILSIVSPSDRPHLILQGVDGELEMKDVCGSVKDSRSRSSKHSDVDSSAENEFSPLPPGSPPLPLDSPPSLPHLPSSPAPPPPPSSPSLPPPPPPPPLPSELPPMAPLPSELPPPVPLPSLIPPPSMLPLPSIPPQSYHISAHQDYSRTQMTGNAPHHGHLNATMNHELFPQAPQFDYGHNDPYIVPQASHQSIQRTYHPGSLAPQTPGSYPKPMVQHHVQQSYPGAYSLPSLTNGRKQFTVDDQWRMPSSEFSLDNQNGNWMNGGRTPPCVGPPVTQDGYFRSPVEGHSTTNNSGFQLPVHNQQSAAASLPGIHGASQGLSYRPYLSAHDSWRPA